MFLVGFFHGFVYIFLIPPWQHYDEPGQFEYAWLIANRAGLPQRGEYDQSMRREVAASMVEHDFYRGMNGGVNLLLQDRPIDIGFAQTGDLPLYYWLAALPLRLFRYSDVSFQLYSARLISFLLYLITILAASGVVAELAPPRHPLRWMVPGMLALLPSFTDLMTAVNNDVGATAFFSLFLFFNVRLMQRGFTWPALVGLVGTAAACFWTKTTVTIALLLLPLPVLFLALGTRRRWLAWAFFFFAGFGGLLAIFAWGDAAHWSRQTMQDYPTRAASAAAPLGSWVFRIAAQPGDPHVQVIQLLGREEVRSLNGKMVTLGAWMWADQETRARTPAITEASRPATFQEVTLGPKPAFYAFSGLVSANARRIYVSLAPAIPAEAQTVQVYYDGIVLVEGERPLSEPPSFDDPAGTTGHWGTQPFINYLQNASAEASWPWLRPWAESIIAKYYPVRPSLVLSAVLDWPLAVWYHQRTINYMFNTFWARFGWGHVPLLGYRPYLILGIITLLGVIGAGIAVWRRRIRLSWEVLAFFSIVLLGVWIPASLRGAGSLNEAVFIPSARYAYPAIIPTVLLLTSGWLEILSFIQSRLNFSKKFIPAAFLLFFLGLAALSIVSILKFY